jgi:hypothetical protein
LPHSLTHAAAVAAAAVVAVQVTKRRVKELQADLSHSDTKLSKSEAKVIELSADQQVRSSGCPSAHH